MRGYHTSWRLFTACCLLSVGRSLDSINLDLKDLDKIDLSPLGTPNLDRYKLEYNVTVDESCQYRLALNFFTHEDEVPGDPEFTGVCDPEETSSKAPDGKEWHEERRHWMRFPPYVFATTGFDHMSLNWVPCGRYPKGLRQARYDLNLYTVIPQHRVFWTCKESGTPKRCDFKQDSFEGRAHFVIPRVERNGNFFANMPAGYQPDSSKPQAWQYEGLNHWDDELIPETAADWNLPQMDMSTYDGDVTTFRAMLPHFFVTGGNSSEYFETQFYFFQTQPRLPAGWNMTYSNADGEINVILYGSAGVCGPTFEALKAEQEEELEDSATRRLRDNQ